MTNDETNELVLLLARTLRSQWQQLHELGTQLQAVCDYLEQRDPKFVDQFSAFENRAKDEVAVPVNLSLQKLDDIIRRLEAGRKPTKMD